jgi:hypothetical protein
MMKKVFGYAEEELKEEHNNRINKNPSSADSYRHLVKEGFNSFLQS